MAFVLSAAFAPAARAQAGSYSLDVALDPRTVALGEAGVAIPGSTDAFASNPAGLAACSGLWMEYARRGMEWTEGMGIEGMQFRSWSAGLSTRYGTFMLGYRRGDMGEMDVSTSDSPGGIGAKVKMYNHVFGAAWGYALSPAVQLGAVAKAFTLVQTVEGRPAAGGFQPVEATPAYLIDLGVLLNSGRLIANGGAADNLSLGVALQNFGTDFRIKQAAVGQAGSGLDMVEPLPRMIRVGLAYQVRMGKGEPEGWIPLQAMVVGEYRKVLNSLISGNERYWGWGVELTGCEVFSVRLGGYFQPWKSVFGAENRAALRLGTSVELPLRRIAAGWWPVTIEASYTAIPLYNVGFSPGLAGTANVFSFGLRYDGEILAANAPGGIEP